MAYKKTYRKTYRKRAFKKRAKRSFRAKRVAKKMDNRTTTKRVAFTQSFSLNNFSGGASSNVPFLIDLLGTSGGGPILNNFYVALDGV